MRTPSFGSGTRKSNYSRQLDDEDEGELRRDHHYGGVGGAMLPIFLNDLRDHNDQNLKDLVEVTLELENDSIFICNVTPPATTPTSHSSRRFLERSLSVTSKLRHKFSWLRSASSRTSTSDVDVRDAADVPRVTPAVPDASRDARKVQAKLLARTSSSSQRALKGLRFISKNHIGSTSPEAMWKEVEARFDRIAKDGLICRESFGACIGMDDCSKEFAVGIFDALARRRRQKVWKIGKDELYEFWLQVSDQSFDARLQIFFDMADSNEDGRITRQEIQELIMLSASANKLSKLKEQAEEYSSLIMEELDPENLGYIELWQLETLLLQKDTYMNYSRPLSSASVSWSQTGTKQQTKNMVHRFIYVVRCLVLEHWRRGWIFSLWVMIMACLFSWKFCQYRNRAAFQVMGNCLATAKGAAETLKLNMALVLLPVSRNMLTWLRSTRARLFVPFDDNIYFHKIIACAIAIGIFVHAGNHLVCDFPRLVNSSTEEFASISSDFNNKKPSYKDLLLGVEGVTGILMVILMAISFTLATNLFRRRKFTLPPPFNRLTGFNAFWYSHHLLGLVYILLLIHGTFVYLVHKWYEKTTWMYISVPLFLYAAERSLRTCRSEHYSVKILKVAVLPGNVISLIMSKPQGFKYKSGQYTFLQCPIISKFEWHPFSITSAPGDNYLSVHIRTVGDWTEELKRVFTEISHSPHVIGRAEFGEQGKMGQRGLPRLLLDGPYGAPAQDHKKYDVLLLVGLGIGATPFISIVRDLLNNARTVAEQTDSNTEMSRSENSQNSNSSSSMTPGIEKRSHWTTKAYFYWVTREPGSFEWFKGVMDEVAEIDHRGQIDMHNYLTSVYEEGDARSTLLTMVQALNHAKHGVDILSGTRVRTHFARPNWREVFTRIASKHPFARVGVFYCGMPVLAKELKKLSHEMSHKTSTRFDFHKEYF